MLKRCCFVFSIACLSIARAEDAGVPAERAVHTNREVQRKLALPKGDDVFHFLIFGDRTGGPIEGLKVLEQGVKDANMLDPDLVMTVGDLIQGYNGQKEWEAEAGEFKAIMDGLKMPWFPVAGNHDVYWRGPDRPEREHEANFEKHFGPLWYWFEHKRCGFLVLFSDEGNPAKGAKDYTNPAQNKFSPEQLEWLKKSLGEMKGLDQVFVFLHHPRWISMTYLGTNWEEVHKALAEAGNVSAVFAGHIHRLNYGGKRDGIEYFTLATTGGALPGTFPGVGYLHHMNVVTVRKKSFNMAILPVGEVIDPREFTPAYLADVDKAREMAPELNSSKIVLGADGLGGSMMEFSLANPSKRPLEVSVISDSPGKEWLFAPEDVHTTLQPGEKKSVSFMVMRVRKGFEGGLGVPSVEMQVDYLGEKARVALPPRKTTLAVGLKPLPDDFFVAEKNQALELDGKSAALRVELPAKEFPDGPLTIEAWVNPGAPNITAPIVAKTEQSEYALNLASNVPGFHLFVGGKYYSAIAATDKSLPAGKWVHIAGVFDGKEMRLYVDGKLAAKVEASGTRATNPLPLYIGADPDSRGEPNMFFMGLVDEIRLSSVARYTEDFTPVPGFDRDKDTFFLFHCDKSLGAFVPSDSALPRPGLVRGSAKLIPAELPR